MICVGHYLYTHYHLLACHLIYSSSECTKYSYKVHQYSNDHTGGRLMYVVTMYNFMCEPPPVSLWLLQIAIEIGPVEIVSVPIKSGVVP